MKSSVAALVIVCGCGLLPGSDAGTSQTLDPARHAAILQDVETTFEALLAADPETAIDGIASHLHGIPELGDVVVDDAARSVFARFVDGTIYIVADPTPDPAAEAEAAISAQLDVAARLTVAERPVEPRALPTGRQYVYLESLTAANGWGAYGDVRGALEDAGYTRLDTPFTVAALETLDWKQAAVVFISAHGGYSVAAAKTAMAIWTAEKVDRTTHDTYLDDIAAGRLAEMTAPTKTGRHGLETHWAIVPAFVTKYVTGGRRALVYVHACYTGINRDMADAFIAGGAAVYLGWDNVVNDATTQGAFVVRDTFGRLLGKAIVPGPTPPMRPVDLQWIYDELDGQLQYTSASAGNVHQVAFYPENSLPVFLRPSIVAMDMLETDGKYLQIRGNFGPYDAYPDPLPHIVVTVGGKTLAPSAAFVNGTAAICGAAGQCPDAIGVTIPDDANGDVVVAIDGLKSEAVPLGDWRPTVTTTQRLDDVCVATYTFKLHFRADVRSFYIRPGAPRQMPTLRANHMPVPAALDTTLTWTVGGTKTGTSYGTVTCSGSGSATLSLPGPPTDGKPWFTIDASYVNDPATGIPPELEFRLGGTGNLVGAFRHDDRGTTSLPLDLAYWDGTSSLHPIMKLDAAWTIQAGDVMDDVPGLHTTWPTTPAVVAPTALTPE